MPKKYVKVDTNFKNDTDGQLRKVYILVDAIVAIEDIKDQKCINICLNSGRSVVAMGITAEKFLKEIK